MQYTLCNGSMNPIEITSAEYDCFKALLVENRVKEVEEDIKRMARVYGVEATKSAVRNILKNL